MYGHGAPPPTRSLGLVITLRVVFAACGVFTCGFLACVPLFRVAYLRDRWFHWLVAWVATPVPIICLAVVGSVPDSDNRGDIAMAVTLILGAVATAYFLLTDIQFRGVRRVASAGYAPHAQTVPSGYGYPQPMPPYLGAFPAQPTLPQPSVPQPSPPWPQVQHPVAQPYMPGVPAQPPSPPSPSSGRIDQVRAELDELSDYLRKHDDHEEDR